MTYSRPANESVVALELCFEQSGVARARDQPLVPIAFREFIRDNNVTLRQTTSSNVRAKEEQNWTHEFALGIQLVCRLLETSRAVFEGLKVDALGESCGR